MPLEDSTVHILVSGSWGPDLNYREMYWNRGRMVQAPAGRSWVGVVFWKDNEMGWRDKIWDGGTMIYMGWRDYDIYGMEGEDKYFSI